MIRRPPRSTQSRSSAASDVYKRQAWSTLRGVYPRHIEHRPQAERLPTRLDEAIIMRCQLPLDPQVTTPCQHVRVLLAHTEIHPPPSSSPKCQVSVLSIGCVDPRDPLHCPPLSTGSPRQTNARNS
eukprot:TRINITY_DN1428_c0_g1_i1.p1 TRINITY_DN1428_c0_g1~~TRINITY_DN1428_c0_g1_i1.p1  ORF type:complete len:126 (+),score=14.08 TRINITY_DN1428_c0_g1_i1:86-463(+)